MKKTVLVTAFLFVCAGFLLAQGIPLADINLSSLEHQQKGMLVLGGWAVANILSGSIFAGRTEGAQRYFHQMNI